MANITQNLKLEKPLQTESYDIDVHNRNSDKIDNAFNDYKNKLQEHKNANPMDHPDGSVKLKHMSTNSVGQEQIINNAITDSKIGDRSIGVQAKVNGSLTYQLTELSKMINAIIGRGDSVAWNTTPSQTITSLLRTLDQKQSVGNYAHLGSNGKVLESELPPLNYAHLIGGKVPKSELPELSAIEMRHY